MSSCANLCWPVQLWVTLASLTSHTDARLAFARRQLLSKTLATVHLMEQRALANVLWGIGKLKVDLKEEGIGPYLAEAIEERVQALVRGGSIDDGRHAAQLWYGLVFLQYTWSRELLCLLVGQTVPLFLTWELKAQGLVSP